MSQKSPSDLTPKEIKAMAKEHMLLYRELVASKKKDPTAPIRINECNHYGHAWFRIFLAAKRGLTFDQIKQKLGDMYATEIWAAFYSDPDRYGCTVPSVVEDGHIPNYGNVPKS